MNKLDRTTPESLRGNPRATLLSWQKYEQIVKAAMERHPHSYVYPCSTLRPTTVASRLRDAIRGKIAFDYPSDLSTDDVTRWYSEIIIKFDTENVYIGPLEKVSEVLEGHGQFRGENVMSFPTLAFEEIAAFALLLSNGRISGPVHVHQPPNLDLLGELPNLERITREDGSLVLI